MKKLNCVAIIPARYASTRFPGKLLEKIENKSILQHTYENAKRCPAIDEILIATEDERIRQHVCDFGGQAILTSPFCLNGTERICEAYQKKYLSQGVEVKVVLNLQGDEPCISEETIIKTIDLIRNHPTHRMATAVAPISSEEEAVSPSVVKCIFNAHFDALYFSRSLIPRAKSRLYDPLFTYYKHIGIYAFQPEFLLHYNALSSTPLQTLEDLEQLKVLEHGHAIKVAVVKHSSIGVDLPEDLEKVRCYMKNLS